MFELAIYSWKRCKRLVLNKENKGKEQICLSRTEYKIHEDVILELKQEGPEAMLSIASGQNLVSDGELVFEYALGEENVFSVFTGYGQELVILVNKRESVIAPLQKYYSSMVGRLRAGAAADNDFVIDHPLVSGHHMEISCEERGMVPQGQQFEWNLCEWRESGETMQAEWRRDHRSFCGTDRIWDYFLCSDKTERAVS